MSLAYDAVLLLGFGGPESEPEVLPFLERVTAGRGIPPQRLREVGEHYYTLGGVSPINQQNRELLAALTAALATQGIKLPTALANRNSPPFVPDVLADLAGGGHRRILAVATAAYPGYSACRQYREDLAAAQAATGLDVALAKLPPFYDLPQFAATIARLLVDSLPGDLDLHAPTTQLVFTTHSIPVMSGGRSGGAGRPPAGPAHPGATRATGAAAGVGTGDAGRGGPTAVPAQPRAGGGAAASGMDHATPVKAGTPAPGGAYLEAHLEVAARIAAEVERLTGRAKDWRLVFQSRSGPPSMPWLEPDVNDALTAIAAAGARDVVLVPIGFLSDHMEVIWDLDTQAQQTAAQVGLRLVRTPTVGTDPQFIAAFAGLIARELRTGSAPAGPGQFCYGDCCANPRRPADVAPGLAPLEQPAHQGAV